MLQEPFKLSDALEVLARHSGFESWRALKTGVQELTDITKSATPAVVLRVRQASQRMAAKMSAAPGFAGLADIVDHLSASSTQSARENPKASTSGDRPSASTMRPTSATMATHPHVPHATETEKR